MNAIVWPVRNPQAFPSESFPSDLAARLAGRVKQAYIFGSYTTGAFRPGSDIDLILVVETDLPFIERPRLFNDLYELFPRLDILVYRPAELEAQLAEPVGFWKSVAGSMREIELFAKP